MVGVSNEASVQRRLAAILAADVVGYSRMIGLDETGTLARLRQIRHEIVNPVLAEHGGRIFKLMGDGLLAEFPSAVQALRAAIAMQGRMRSRNERSSEGDRIEVRIGVHQGDVVVEGHDLLGDGVNVAARLEALAEPGGICISARVHEDAVGKVAVDAQDMGEQALKNIGRPIRVFRVALGDAPDQRDPEVAAVKPPLPLPDKPSIAVLPFENMSGDPDQQYFADGMVEEIITALSRIRWLFVVARNSSFTYKGQAVDVKRVGRELGVLYLLEGSVRKSGRRIRITVQLIETINGAHLWADHFDGPLEDVFELQDNVATRVAGVIEPELKAAEVRRSNQRPTNDLTAYDLYLRASADTASWQRERVLRAKALLEQALERDPRFGPALALAAVCLSNLYISAWADDLEAIRQEGIALARRALRVAEDDPNVLSSAAYVLGLFGEDIAAAIALIDRALQLNPSYAAGWYHCGILKLWAGQPDVAIKHFETFIRLSPRQTMARVFFAIGMAHFFARRLEEAKAMLLRSLQEIPTWAPTHRFLASCYAHMGRLDEAHGVVKRLREITPLVIPNADHWRKPEDREFYLSGLRLAVGEVTS
jgi:adenylate cyclase